MALTVTPGLELPDGVGAVEPPLLVLAVLETLPAPILLALPLLTGVADAVCGVCGVAVVCVTGATLATSTGVIVTGGVVIGATVGGIAGGNTATGKARITPDASLSKDTV
jgi:hypothetical protein